jgi:hypothetical protein
MSGEDGISAEGEGRAARAGDDTGVMPDMGSTPDGAVI